MNDMLDKLLENFQKGYSCSQVMLLVALEIEGKENPELIRAISGLRGGIGRSGEVCGALSGGMCLLSYFGGKGTDEEEENENIKIMSKELYNWFVSYTSEYGGIDCRQIKDDNPDNRLQRCATVVRDTLEKSISILQEYKLI
ncbi:MAG TPA: C_GCAxxG_C_C family protein [Mogibacterium sp.]|nr:C_GCAxxG_C_C family protein [Mogibacterium sp.]